LFFFITLSGIIYAQSPIFQSLKTNQLGWGKVNIIYNGNVEDIIAKHISVNEKAKGFQGYRIQVYFGSGNDAKNQAQKLRSELKNSFPQFENYLIYDSPYFKVKIGDFRTKVEAFKLFKEIQNIYPSAFIVEDLISFPPL
jgi:UDP-2,3-diacylglucosamine pyrophosphatase LpxH